MQSPTTAKLSLLLLGWLALFGVGQSDAVREVRAQERTATTDSLQSARMRWDALPAEDKKRLRSRYDRLKNMDSSERKQLEKRAKEAKRLKAMRNRVLSRLSEEEREKLQSQSPARQRELIEEFVAEERRNQGQRIESKLPKHIRESLRNTPPRERRERLKRFKQDTRERLSRLAVEDLAGALEFGPDEIRRLERLPLDKRVETMMKLGKEFATKQLKTEGLPADFGVERWQELANMPPEKFISEVWRLENIGVLRGGWNGPKAKRERHKERGPSLRQVLAESRRIRPSDILGLSELPQSERRKRMNGLRRERVLEAFRDHEDVDEKGLAELEGLEDWRFFRRARELAEDRGSEPRWRRRQ